MLHLRHSVRYVIDGTLIKVDYTGTIMERESLCESIFVL